MMGNQKAARRAAPNQNSAKRVWFGADFAPMRGGLGK